jgi:mercuric ion binding protein
MRKIPIQSVIAALALTMMATAVAANPLYKLQVAGLACPFCAYGIEKKLSEVPGVDNVDTDIPTETVTVTMRDGQKLEKAAAEKAVRAAGFKLLGLEEIQTGPRK